MVRIYILVCILSASGFSKSHSLNAQHKQDYVWMLSYDGNNSQPGHQILSLDFNNKPVHPAGLDGAFNFDAANVSICDPEGNLLFYTNGCMIANTNHEVMPNGERINYNRYVQDLWDPDCKKFGYPAIQDILLLPDPAHPNFGYFMLHKIRIWEPEIQSSSFMRDILYTYVDMRLDNGNGNVIEKNRLFYSGDMLQGNYFTTMAHDNGRDWWILQPTETGKYLTFLLDTSGIHLEHIQDMGDDVIPGRSSASGTARFSPDGTKYAYFNAYNNLLLYDFDRSTGLLSNLRKIMIREVDLSVIRFSSVEWSPNSRFIYTASSDQLHQVDTWSNPIELGIELIDVYDGTRNPFANRFFLMAQGPDCRIYMCSTNANLAYHVIHYPDLKGKACHFVQNGIQLPQHYSNGSFPNFPRWRVDEEQKCDPSLSTMIGEPVEYIRKLKVWPVPASTELYLDLPDGYSGEIYLLDMWGRLVLRQSIDMSISGQRLDISHIPAGGYVLEFYPSNTEERWIWSGKVVIHR